MEPTQNCLNQAVLADQSTALGTLQYNIPFVVAGLFN